MLKEPPVYDGDYTDEILDPLKHVSDHVIRSCDWNLLTSGNTWLTIRAILNVERGWYVGGAMDTTLPVSE